MKFVPQTVSRAVVRSVFQTRKASPTILLGAGIIGVVGTVVLASRATLKLEDVIKEAEKDLVILDELGTLDEKQVTQMKTQVFLRTGKKLARLYGPSFILGVTSLACLTQSHRIMSQRNAGLAAAYAALDMGFRQYRARVIDELGEEKDAHFRYGVSEREVAVEDEKGNVTTQTVKRAGDGHGPSIYAKFFDQLNTRWQRNPENNRIWLQAQQEYFNYKLQANGVVILNDVYEKLGFEPTKAGAIVGWVLAPENDNFVDFGIFNINSQKARDFVNGDEGAILLDFNVDGVVFQHLDDPRRKWEA